MKKCLTSAHLAGVKNDIEKEYSLNYSNIQKVLSDLKFNCQKEIDQIGEYIGDYDTFPDEMNKVNKNVTDIFLYNLRKINEYLKSFYNKSEKIIYECINQIKKDNNNNLSSFSNNKNKEFRNYINMTEAESYYNRVAYHHKTEFYTPFVYVASKIIDFFTNYKPIHQKIVNEFVDEVNKYISDYSNNSDNDLINNKNYLFEYLDSKYKFFNDKFKGIKKNKEIFKQHWNRMNNYLLSYEKILIE